METSINQEILAMRCASQESSFQLIRTNTRSRTRQERQGQATAWSNLWSSSRYLIQYHKVLLATAPGMKTIFAETLTVHISVESVRRYAMTGDWGLEIREITSDLINACHIKVHYFDTRLTSLKARTNCTNVQLLHVHNPSSP